MNLEPGPELDKLIQEHVLKLIPCEDYHTAVSPMELMKMCDHPEGTCTPSWVVWGYSTQPGWNITVRDWILKQITPDSGLAFFYDESIKDRPWYGYVRLKGPEQKMSFDMGATTLEHLFCLLALKFANAPVDLSEYEESKEAVNES